MIILTDFRGYKIPQATNKFIKKLLRGERMKCKFNETKECIKSELFDKWKDDKVEVKDGS